jgi:hypothetical protein
MADVGVTPYNSSAVPITGGDSLTTDLNVYYDVSSIGSGKAGWSVTQD